MDFCSKVFTYHFVWWNKILVSVNWLLNELNYFSNYWSIKEENWKRIMYLILFTVVYEYIRKKNWTFVPWYLIVWKLRVRKKNNYPIGELETCTESIWENWWLFPSYFFLRLLINSILQWAFPLKSPLQ